jgi:hypothetical protein
MSLALDGSQTTVARMRFTDLLIKGALDCLTSYQALRVLADVHGRGDEHDPLVQVAHDLAHRRSKPHDHDSWNSQRSRRLSSSTGL